MLYKLLTHQSRWDVKHKFPQAMSPSKMKALIMTIIRRSGQITLTNNTHMSVHSTHTPICAKQLSHIKHMYHYVLHTYTLLHTHTRSTHKHTYPTVRQHSYTHSPIKHTHTCTDRHLSIHRHGTYANTHTCTPPHISDMHTTTHI
jgi:DNA-binding transcriptional regulator WhiA